MSTVRETFFALETALHAAAGPAAGRILAEGFEEFGSSGRKYNWNDMVELLRNRTPPGVTMADFSVTTLGDTAALVTYRASVTRPGEAHADESLRSSVWVLRAAGWKIIFHQGTPSG